MIEKLSFKQWLTELAGTGAIYDPKAKGTFNWWGAPGSTGKVIEGDPIKSWTKKHKKKKVKKMWSEMTVYHGSKSPVNNWNKTKQVSGYYPGLYAWPEEDNAKNHGSYVYPLEIDERKFYRLQNGDELKQQARNAGFMTSSGSGYQDVEYLKSIGYEGIIRGKEYIIFDPYKWTESNWIENIIQFPFSTVTEQGIVFKTGTPVTFKYIRGKDIEVAGKYMIHNEEPGDRQGNHWEMGEMTFRNPLVIKFNLNQFGGYDEHSWKFILSQHYGKTGKLLSKAIRKDGYDGIVTTEGNTYTKEIVDISMF